MSEKERRRREYEKMRRAFEWNDWPVPSPQKFHHWTLARQVDQLVTAREADPDLGFMARMMALCSLPRTNPGRRNQYVWRNGPYTLGVVTAGVNNKLPYGNLPRLLLAWYARQSTTRLHFTDNEQEHLVKSLWVADFELNGDAS